MGHERPFGLAISGRIEEGIKGWKRMLDFGLQTVEERWGIFNGDMGGGTGDEKSRDVPFGT